MDLDDLLNLFSFVQRDHSRRVAVCCSMIAEHADELIHPSDVPDGTSLALIAHLGGTCHDIGKLLVPALGMGECEYLTHSSLGADFLEQRRHEFFDNLYQAELVVETVRYHHEQPDDI